MRLINPINLNTLPEPTGGGDFEPIPAGIYDAEVQKCEERVTKAGNGSYLNIQVGISGPTHAGRVVFGMITTSNPNETAVEIGQAQQRELLRAVGLEKLEDTDHLVGRRCRVKVAVECSPGYEPKNTIKGWRPVGNAVPAVARPAPAPRPVPAVDNAPAPQPQDERPDYQDDNEPPF